MTIGRLLVSCGSRIVFMLLLLACFSPSVQAKRRDVVVMNNGDRFTGEVKRLQNGLLYVETDYISDSLGLDWNQVQSVESSAIYKIVLNNGRRVEGKIQKAPVSEAKEADFLIREATEGEDVASASTAVVSLETTKPTFWRQMQGTLDFGYSFASGNNQSALNIDTSGAYKTPGWEASTSFDSTRSGQSGSSKTNREDLQTSFEKFFGRNSFAEVISDFLHSSQQDLQLRTTIGGGYGRYLKRTTNSNLSWLGGVVYANESFDTAAGQPSGQNIEAILGVQYDLIRFSFGEIDSQIQAFPGLTDAGRIRLKTNNSLTIKLRNNFHLAFTFWDNFDSEPPPTAKRNELGVSSGVGWSF